ncbi:hypothetical protein [Neobacillus rhizophilus]|uniref:Uncharacterized protein n=1 Tax=Neobacillus rhizophilus TaxID=2833579 RepID=A0A942U5R5_9BACI|nr:hypothetical protein [Neobacillus rhizophilus]MBS4212868.1 hypothetical protein [Neobacillus rhizophilus]
MDFLYKKEILELEAFRPVLTEIKNVDPAMGENMEQALKAAVKESHELIIKANTTDQLHIGLIKEQIYIQAQSSQYLNITDEITMKKNNLLEFMPQIYNQFMNEVEQEMTRFFQEKKREMYAEIDQDGSWYSGLRDTTKKSGQLYNFAINKINSVSKEFQGKEVISDQRLVDTKSIVENVLEKHLSNQKVTNQVSAIFEAAVKRYKDAWMQRIADNVPDMKRISAFSLTQTTKANLKINFQYGDAEKVLAMGIGSAVFGTVGLAMGWHTLTYALFNVFPPIALFAALATVLVGVLTKDKAVEKRKQDINEAVTRYHHFFLQQLYVLKLLELENKSISEYIELKGRAIVEETVKEWERKYFGNLRMEHFRKLNQAFVRHLMYVNEAVE